MAYEAEITMRVGEKLPVYGEATAESGTLTVQSGGTFTLYDTLNAVVTGWNGVALTGYSAAALSVEVWYVLDTASLAAGVYSAVLEWDTLDSNSLPRTHKATVEIILLAPVEAYDLTTTPGKVRLFLGDTNPDAPIWTEPEITAFLLMAGSRPLLAAAWALEAGAAQAARVAIIERASIFGTDNTKIPALMRDQAKRYRELDLLEEDIITGGGAGSVRDDILEQFPVISLDYPLTFSRRDV